MSDSSPTERSDVDVAQAGNDGAAHLDLRSESASDVDADRAAIAEAFAKLTDAGWQQLRDRLAPLSTQVETLGLTHLLGEQAELVTAAVLESLCERDDEGNYRWSAGPHHGLACPPSLAGFAAVHCRLSRAELGALARLVHSEKTQPQIQQALRRGLVTPRAARRLRAITYARPGLLEVWLEAAAHERRFAFERRTELAIPGQRPESVSVDRPMPAIAPADPDAPADATPHNAERTTQNGLVLRISLALSHLDAYWWHLAAGRAGRLTKKGYLGPMATLTAIVERLADEVAAGHVPASLDAIAPWGEFHIDAIDQRAWVNAGRNGLGIGLDEIPRPGDRVVAEIISEERRRLPHSRAAALEAWPELADDVLPPTPDDPTYQRFVRTGLVSWGVSRLIPDPARALPARDHAAMLTAEAQNLAAPLPGGAAGRSPAPGDPDDPLNSTAAAEATLAKLERWPLTALSVPERQALAVAAARTWHHAEGREAELVVQASPDLEACPPDPLFHTLDALGYFEGEAALTEQRTLVKRLEVLPQLRNTLDAGLCSYTHARIAARRASANPEYDADWADLAQRVDTTALHAFARATPTGEAPPRVPEASLPIRPAGGKLPLQLRGTLDAAAAEHLTTVLAALATLAGRELGETEWVPLIAKWYCQITQSWTHHTVIYHRSPETRGAVFPRARLAASLWHIAPGPRGSTQRLEAAMAWVTDWDEDRPDRRAHRALRAGERYTPPVIEDIVRWMDGGGCRTAGCTNDTSQHDHGNPVGEGGHADAAIDGRRCGPDNRARNKVRDSSQLSTLDSQLPALPAAPADSAVLAAAEPQPWLQIEHGPFGTEIARDRWGRRLGSVRRLYAAWDEPVRRWLMRRAHEVWLESPTLMTPFWDAVEDEELRDPAAEAYARPARLAAADEEAIWLAQRDVLANAGVAIPDWATTGPDPHLGDPRWGFF